MKNKIKNKDKNKKLVIINKLKPRDLNINPKNIIKRANNIKTKNQKRIKEISKSQ